MFLLKLTNGKEQLSKNIKANQRQKVRINEEILDLVLDTKHLAKRWHLRTHLGSD